MGARRCRHVFDEPSDDVFDRHQAGDPKAMSAALERLFATKLQGRKAQVQVAT